jgi:hypothetical protein
MTIYIYSGGCDNCDFSHVFDCLTAGRVKWVALYPFRKLIDGREHTAPWSTIFVDGTGISRRVDKSTFISKVKTLPYALSMGPSVSVAADEAPGDDSLGALWDKLMETLVDHHTDSQDTRTDRDKNSLSAEEVSLAGSLR